jgi:hypothetical protein
MATIITLTDRLQLDSNSPWKAFFALLRENHHGRAAQPLQRNRDRHHR